MHSKGEAHNRIGFGTIFDANIVLQRYSWIILQLPRYKELGTCHGGTKATTETQQIQEDGYTAGEPSEQPHSAQSCECKD